METRDRGHAAFEQEMAVAQEVPAAQEVAAQLEAGEGQPRTLAGPLARLVTAVALILAAFHIWTGWQGAFPNLIQRALHLGLVFVLVFLLYPPLHRMRDRNRVRALDWLLAGLSVVTMAYIVIDYDRIIDDPTVASGWDLLLGIVAILLVLEAARRTVGIVFPAISVLFIIYGYLGPIVPGLWGHAGFTPVTVIQTLYLETEGILGTITGVSATVIAAFMLFGAVLYHTGGGATYVDIALYVVGRSHGGLGKVSCVSSALFGIVSGSTVANVVVDGVFNIPLMKRAGYRSDIAAAIEATASSGGQMVPPVMGAGAFIMAELLNVPYLHIATSAAVPALLYYTGVVTTVHFEGRKGRLQPAPKERIPPLSQLARWPRLGPLFVPVGVLLIMLTRGYVPSTSAFYSLLTSLVLFTFGNRRAALGAIPAVIVVAALLAPPAWRIIPDMAVGAMLAAAVITYFLGAGSIRELQGRCRELVKALDNGARSIVYVAPLVANASLIVAMVGLTGLGVKISEMILEIAGGSFFLSLVFGMIVSLVMGMGVPTMAAYVLAASVVAPSLIQLGLPPLAAHLFVFYYAIIANITPPICAAVYVAAALARARWLPTAYQSMRLALAGFIAPYMFVYTPALLLLAVPEQVIWRSAMAIVGVTAMSVATVGFLTRRLNALERLLFAAAAATLVFPQLLYDVVGLGLLSAGYLWQKLIPRDQTS